MVPVDPDFKILISHMHLPQSVVFKVVENNMG